MDRYSYLPFGETTTLLSAIPNPFTHGGQYGASADGSGLIHMGLRDFSPTVGQFVSNDPLGITGGDPNVRRYVFNDPIQYVDPSGLAAWPSGFVNALPRGGQRRVRGTWRKPLAAAAKSEQEDCKD